MLAFCVSMDNNNAYVSEKVKVGKWKWRLIVSNSAGKYEETSFETALLLLLLPLPHLLLQLLPLGHRAVVLQPPLSGAPTVWKATSTSLLYSVLLVSHHRLYFWLCYQSRVVKSQTLDQLYRGHFWNVVVLCSSLVIVIYIHTNTLSSFRPLYPNRREPLGAVAWATHQHIHHTVACNHIVQAVVLVDGFGTLHQAVGLVPHAPTRVLVGDLDVVVESLRHWCFCVCIDTQRLNPHFK